MTELRPEMICHGRGDILAAVLNFANNYEN